MPKTDNEPKTPTPSNPDANQRWFINSLAKGLDCLATFRQKPTGLTLSEVAKANDMNLVTAQRYLKTLCSLGYLQLEERSKTYKMTTKVLRLGAWILERTDLRTRLLVFLDAINSEFDVTTSCSILDGQEVVYLDRRRSSEVVNLDITAGSRLPIHSTSQGKAIAAFLPPEERERLLDKLDYLAHTRFTKTSRQELVEDLDLTRQRRYAVSFQELSLGLSSVAVPVFDQYGNVEGSFGVSMPSHRLEQAGLLEALVKRLMQVTRQASSGLPACYRGEG